MVGRTSFKIFSVVCFLNVYGAVSASTHDFIDQISWLGSDLKALTLSEIISHPKLNNLLPVDIESELEKYQSQNVEVNETTIATFKSKSLSNITSINISH